MKRKNVGLVFLKREFTAVPLLGLLTTGSHVIGGSPGTSTLEAGSLLPLSKHFLEWDDLIFFFKTTSYVGILSILMKRKLRHRVKGTHLCG